MKRQLIIEKLSKKNLTIEERVEWFRHNPPKERNINSYFDMFLWKCYVKEMEQDLYSYCFNNPIYCGNIERSDDEERHLLLDELDIPRKVR